MIKKLTPTNGAKNYWYVSDGTHILYLEKSDFWGKYSVSSVHYPSREVGTGFRLAENIVPTEEYLKGLFGVIAPLWATAKERSAVKPFKNLKEFIEYKKKHWGQTYKVSPYVF